MTRVLLATLTLIGLAGLPAPVAAFCGFYVSGADASLYNNATMVVMMREGTRTVLSMQNNYQGPPEDFAMVVPVPIVLQEENVKTLPPEIFARVDKLAAPRLVEYWEADPCAIPQYALRSLASGRGGMVMEMAPAAEADDMGVTIEAQFEVAEYDVVILSAEDSTGLDRWLRHNRYNIPEGAEPVLRPYVEAGTKFFVAKVDVEKVRFENDRAVLSPLRFHYDSPEFSLPVRLGLLNSAGEQDLLVHILARSQRYEVANYDNVTIPTNIRVADAVREEFGGFYDALFRKTLEARPGAVVTEYSWNASSCDPCPEPALTPQELMTLGGDAIGPDAPPLPGGGRPIVQPRRPVPAMFNFVLTRLHYRYNKDDLGNDLVFRAAPPIVGGRGMPDQEGQLSERDVQPGQINNFQGRFVILHPWEGEVACENPQRGRWGGPPGENPRPGIPTPPSPIAAGNTAMRGGSIGRVQLATMVKEDIPTIGVRMGEVEEEPEPEAEPEPPSTGGGRCNRCDVASGDLPTTGIMLAGIFALALFLRRRNSA